MTAHDQESQEYIDKKMSNIQRIRKLLAKNMQIKDIDTNKFNKLQQRRSENIYNKYTNKNANSLSFKIAKICPQILSWQRGNQDARGTTRLFCRGKQFCRKIILKTASFLGSYGHNSLLYKPDLILNLPLGLQKLYKL